MSKTAGIILILLGVAGLAYGGFRYTTQEPLIDIGPIHATREKTRDFPVSPVLGGLAVLSGILLLIVKKA